MFAVYVSWSSSQERRHVNNEIQINYKISTVAGIYCRTSTASSFTCHLLLRCGQCSSRSAVLNRRNPYMRSEQHHPHETLPLPCSLWSRAAGTARYDGSYSCQLPSWNRRWYDLGRRGSPWRKCEYEAMVVRPCSLCM
jgi:hypothetical protein